MTEEVKVPKRIIILDAINAGGATKESLMEIATCSSASLATNFTYLRLMGHCPVKAEDNTYSVVSEDEWNEIVAERKANAKTRKTATPKTPEAVLDAAVKRKNRCDKALVTATTKDEQFNVEITNLRLTIATAEARLAEIALEEAVAAMPIQEDVEYVEETETMDDELV